MEKNKCNYNSVPLAVCIGLACGFVAGPIAAAVGAIIGFVFAEWYYKL